MLAANREVLQAARPGGKLKDEWIASLIATVRQAASLALPGADPVPDGLSACSAGWAVASRGVRSDSIERVLALALESLEDKDHG